MAINGYSAFPKAAALLEPHYQIVLCYILDTRLGVSYPSAVKQSVYSTAPSDWSIFVMVIVFGNGLGKQSSNTRWGYFFWHKRLQERHMSHSHQQLQFRWRWLSSRREEKQKPYVPSKVGFSLVLFPSFSYWSYRNIWKQITDTMCCVDSWVFVCSNRNQLFSYLLVVLCFPVHTTAGYFVLNPHHERFGFFVAYQTSRVICCLSHPWRTVVVLKPLIEWSGVHNLPKGIDPKVTVITWLDFKLAYFEAAVQHFGHYATRTPHQKTVNHSLLHPCSRSIRVKTIFKYLAMEQSIGKRIHVFSYGIGMLSDKKDI